MIFSKIFKLSLLLTKGVIISLVILLQSCVKDNFDFNKLAQTEWSPNIAVPLVYSSLTIQDIITKGDTKGNMRIGSDNFCTLIYTGHLLSTQASDLIVIPNQSYNQNISLNASAIAIFKASGSFTATASQTISFNSGGTTEIDTLIYKSGTLDLSISSDFQHSGQVVITIPGARKNGFVLSKTFPLNYTGSVPVTAAVSVDLTGYSFDMTKGSGTTFNQFIVDYDFTLNNSGNPVTSSNQLSVSPSFNDQKFDKVFGYIGQQLLSPDNDTIRVSIFGNESGIGTFTLVEPKVKAYISNSYGIPIQANFAQFDGYTPSKGNFPVTGSGVPNPLPIKTPSVSQIGQVLVDSFILDKTNSNIVNIVNNKPKYVVYKLNSQSNPGGKTGRNFVIDTSRFSVNLEVEMPLYGTAMDFTIQDTMDFEFGDIENIESFQIRTDISNGFPIDVGVQIYFTDTLYNVLDSLVTPYQIIMPSAMVSSTTGKVTAPARNTSDFTFNKTRSDHLTNAKKIIIKGVASTTNNGSSNVKIYTDYKLDVKLGAKAQLKVKL